MDEITYPIALKGLGNEFPQSEQPLEFARKLVNRFINVNGQSEKRPGLKKIESPYTNFYTGVLASAGSQPGKIKFLAEHASSNGEEQLLCGLYSTTASSNNILKFQEDWQSWQEVAVLSSAGDQFSEYLRTNAVSVSGRFITAQAGDKTVISNPDYVTMYYNKGQVSRLLPVIESGKMTTGASANKVVDSGVTSWISGTFVANNDLVWNITKSSYGIVTSVGAANLDVSPMGSAANGATGLGVAAVTAALLAENAPGDYYKIIDLVENNIFEPASGIKDNVALAGADTNASVIAVTAFNFQASQILQNDYVYNTTRNAITRVISVSGNIRVADVSGQVAGDSLVFMKSAVPVADFAHAHYSRLYLIDTRDKSKVRVSGPNDAEDFTTFTQTLQSTSIDYGANQPQGEKLITLGSYQRYLVAGSDRNVYVDEGTNPIADTSTSTADLSPVGLFNQGVASPRPFANIGREMLFLSRDGARTFNITDILAVDTDNISEQIKSELRDAIQSNSYDSNLIQSIHYPKRNWVLFKVGNTIYNFNYTPIYVKGDYIRGGTWSKFTGLFAQCDEFLVRQDGTLIASYYDSSTNANYLYEFDTGNYLDDTQEINTEYESAWLTLEVGSGNGIIKDGRYIKPYFECYGDTVYNIKAIADLETQTTCDSVVVSAAGGGGIGSMVVEAWPVGGAAIANQQKYPFRWRGEQVKVNIATSGGQGKETISKFILYGNKFGRK